MEYNILDRKTRVCISAGGKKYRKPIKKPVYNKERQAKYMRKMNRRKQYISKMIHYLIFLSEGIDINNWTSSCKKCGNEMNVIYLKKNFKNKKNYCSKECYAKGEKERFNEKVLKYYRKNTFINRFINRLAYVNGVSHSPTQYWSIKKLEERNKPPDDVLRFCELCNQGYYRSLSGTTYYKYCSDKCAAARTILKEKIARMPKNRTPKWVTEEQLLEMARMHRFCSRDDDLDHIVPLKGENVSGLNVPWNMRYLEHEENISKGNHFGEQKEKDLKSGFPNSYGGYVFY